MSTRFNREDVNLLLAACHRRCCICHRFCGVKIETDHIVPLHDGGTSEIANAIPLCFECHAEVHSYNEKHPRGRKYTPAELRAHKDQWLALCREMPSELLAPTRASGVGPLQALLDELDFNLTASNPDLRRCPLHDEQFRRAIHAGAIALLEPSLKKDLLEAYAAIGRANQTIVVEAEEFSRTGRATGFTAIIVLTETIPLIQAAYDRLLSFLASES